MSQVTSRILSVLGTRREVVADVRIGLGYTAVLLEGGGLGLAYTFRNEAQGGCTVFQGLRPLASRPVTEVLPLLESEDRIEAAVGLACANALLNRSASSAESGDVLRQIEIREDDDVAMVGRFGPLIEPLRDRARSLLVLERNGAEDTLPASRADRILPNCQVAIITATSIINHTIDGLLEAAKGCREVVILGPSTPLVPQVFEGTSVTVLSGVVARSPSDVLQVVSEGGGTRTFGPYVRKVSMRLDSRDQ